jgi:hypothetical protein
MLKVTDYYVKNKGKNCFYMSSIILLLVHKFIIFNGQGGFMKI